MTVKGRDILLTGLPRGGTTLVCELLNQVAETVALDEPLCHVVARTISDTSETGLLAKFIETQRMSLVTSGMAITKLVDGGLGNHYGSRGDGRRPRRSRTTRARVFLKQPLTSAFTLTLKEPSAFTALLPL